MHSGLPVVDPETGAPVGWLTHLDVLQAYNARLEGSLDDSAATQGQDSVRRPGGVFWRLRGHRIVELGLSSSDPPVGRRLDELDWPARAKVLTLRRGGQAIEPDGDERLQQGDCLIVLLPASEAEGLVDRISAPRETA